MKKVLIAAVVLILALPILPRIIPKPVTFERIQAALAAQGLAVSDVREATTPQNQAVAQVDMSVQGASVRIYLYDHEGKIAKQLEFQKPDAGSQIVATWNLSESLGAAKPKNRPLSAARNGLFMLTVESEDKALRDRVVRIFKGV